MTRVVRGPTTEGPASRITKWPRGCSQENAETRDPLQVYPLKLNSPQISVIILLPVALPSFKGRLMKLCTLAQTGGTETGFKRREMPYALLALGFAFSICFSMSELDVYNHEDLAAKTRVLC